MNQAKYLFAVVCMAVLPVAVAAIEPADIERGKEASVLCTACHKVDGGGQENDTAESWPRIAGLNADYIIKQIQDIKNGSRETITMMPFANLLTEQQLVDLAAYYASLPVPELVVKDYPAERLAKGRELVLLGDWERFITPCATCHGPDNQGVGSQFPPIANQHAGYIKQQLTFWQEGKRHNDNNELMVSIAKRLTPEDIEAIAAYLSQQSVYEAQLAAKAAEGEES